ncbi:DUF6460 domain-containing protein [Emcibacter nanhaiensis]|uniref:Integrase n=1 Tax=Emcibacter nanhaiensis TaxID=1505037 RepID=A0A501PBZ5_9PROT|nr:DUF6460 domain-containing protein [Emcibacter nanhaiensis]TPD57532.1 integrase [Emcibacter nanhaiensis]
MNKRVLGIVWKLIIASLFVGMALSYFDITPAELIEDLPETIGKIVDTAWSGIQWAADYVVLGAIVVVPVWLLMNVTNIANRFKKKE